MLEHDVTAGPDDIFQAPEKCGILHRGPGQNHGDQIPAFFAEIIILVGFFIVRTFRPAFSAFARMTASPAGERSIPVTYQPSPAM
jgi:hypothetical protein